MADSGGQCNALNLSDKQRCEDAATSVNGLFCSFHSRQCQGLYRGYKNRNARLDNLDQNPPSYLAQNLTEVSKYLTLKHSLLERVIRARKLHHSQFFSMNMDYDHQHYLDNLSNQKYIVLRAIEKLERRIAEFLYQRQEWFNWARDVQQFEEEERDTEKKKVKAEAAMFRRHEKEIAAHRKQAKDKEYASKQEAILEQAYLGRMSEKEREEQEAEWDPIKDAMEDEREAYVDLIKHFLFLSDHLEQQNSLTNGFAHSANPSSLSEVVADAAEPSPAAPSATASTTKMSAKTRKKKKPTASTDKSASAPDKSSHDTCGEIARRLKEGVQMNHAPGMHVAGTVMNPSVPDGKTAPLSDEEIETILKDVSEIKILLFCRLLLSQAAILPAAVRASSVEEFFMDPEVTDTDLRDLCLRLEKPKPQEIRDACADLGRKEEEDVPSAPKEEIEPDSEDEAHKKHRKKQKAYGLEGPKHGPEYWSSEFENQMKDKDLSVGPMPGSMMKDVGNQMINFDQIDKDDKVKSRKVRVKVCGRYIYHYPSEKAVSRGGWLHFCIVAKDSSLSDAVQLCRHWDEFWELNILAIYQYFPAANWAKWKGDIFKQQWLTLGFIPYFQFDDAHKVSESHQTGSRGQQLPRQHAIREFRNFVCAHVRRNCQASRRFLQYISMRTDSVLCVVRDGKTGKVLHKPRENNAEEDNGPWLARQEAGLGRAAKNEWTLLQAVDRAFFEKIDSLREWRFGFDDYFDLYVFDLVPGQDCHSLYGTIVTCLMKAHRCRISADTIKQSEHILRSLAHNPDTLRTRDFIPGEDTKSIWDECMESTFRFMNPSNQDVEKDDHQNDFYQEADALEDEVLFPHTKEGVAAFKNNALDRFVKTPPDWARFINEDSTDEEFDESESESGSESDLGDISPQKLDQLSLPTGTMEDDHYSDGSSSDEERQASELMNDPKTRMATTIACTDPAFRIWTKNDDGTYVPLAERFSEAVLSQMPESWKPDVMATRGWWSPYEGPRARDPQTDFMTFMDREKSEPFKESWHQADMTPGAQERWEHQHVLAVIAKTANLKKAPFKHFADLRFVNVHPERHRRMCADMVEARALISAFFPSEFDKDKLTSPTSRLHPLLDQETPYDALGLPEQKAYTDAFDKLPREWDNVTRPIVATLFKAGIIHPCPTNDVPGQAIAARDPACTNPAAPLDMFIDYRINLRAPYYFNEGYAEPASIDALLAKVSSFAQQHGAEKARFTFLRLWQAPHFYPLMLGHDKRLGHAFTYCIGRAWEWKFVPTDMPYSEWSMQCSAHARVEPYLTNRSDNSAVNVNRAQRRRRGGGEGAGAGLGGDSARKGKVFTEGEGPEGNLLLRRNLFLLCARDEEEALRLATALAFAVTTQPWRLEVDLWGNFVNVDEGFVKGTLRREWLE